MALNNLLPIASAQLLNLAINTVAVTADAGVSAAITNLQSVATHCPGLSDVKSTARLSEFALASWLMHFS